MANRGGCDHICTDVQGGYQCSCNTGYELFTKDGTANFTLHIPENGELEGDVKYLNHTCVRKLSSVQSLLLIAFYEKII